MFANSDHRYDVVIYGASGFTGQYVLESFVNSEEYNKSTIAVAGRSEKKLQQTLNYVGNLTGLNLLTKICKILLFRQRLEANTRDCCRFG